MALRWSKRLSKTDAQQRTLGYKVPYLRLTKSNSRHDTQSWFRDVFFGDLKWKPGVFGKHDVEKASVNAHVSIDGENRGVRKMMVTHDPDRQENHNAPNTWLHYDDATRDDLESEDFTGETVVLQRDDDGAFHLTI